MSSRKSKHIIIMEVNGLKAKSKRQIGFTRRGTHFCKDSRIKRTSLSTWTRGAYNRGLKECGELLTLQAKRMLSKFCSSQRPDTEAKESSLPQRRACLERFLHATNLCKCPFNDSVKKKRNNLRSKLGQEFPQQRSPQCRKGEIRVKFLRENVSSI